MIQNYSHLSREELEKEFLKNEQEILDKTFGNFVYYGCTDTYLIKEIDNKKNSEPRLA